MHKGIRIGRQPKLASSAGSMLMTASHNLFPLPAEAQTSFDEDTRTFNVCLKVPEDVNPETLRGIRTAWETSVIFKNAIALSVLQTQCDLDSYTTGGYRNIQQGKTTTLDLDLLKNIVALCSSHNSMQELDPQSASSAYLKDWSHIQAFKRNLRAEKKLGYRGAVRRKAKELLALLREGALSNNVGATPEPVEATQENKIVEPVVRTKVAQVSIGITSKESLNLELEEIASKKNESKNKIANDFFVEGFELLKNRLKFENTSKVFRDFEESMNVYSGHDSKRWMLRVERRMYNEVALLAQRFERSLAQTASLCIAYALSKHKYGKD